MLVPLATQRQGTKSPGRAVEVLWVAFNDLGFPGSHLGSLTTISQTGETAPDKSVRIGHLVDPDLGKRMDPHGLDTLH